MNRRQALGLLGSGGIGLLFNARSPVLAYSTQSVQPPPELVELEKRVGEYVIERRMINNFPTISMICTNCGDLNEIVPRGFMKGYLRIEGDEFRTSIEVRVYYRDDAQELNWNEPKNYLRLSWTDSQFESTFTDNGIDGIVEESSIPVIANRQSDFLQYLQRIENLFLQK